MTREDVLAAGRETFPDVDFGALGDDETLGGVGFDSLDAAEFIMDLEGRHGVAIPDAVMTADTTWGEFVKAATQARAPIKKAPGNKETS